MVARCIFCLVFKRLQSGRRALVLTEALAWYFAVVTFSVLNSVVARLMSEPKSRFDACRATSVDRIACSNAALNIQLVYYGLFEFPLEQTPAQCA